jgi:hypothetical protein
MSPAALGVIAILLLSSLGCATGVNSPTGSVLISSEPMGADVVVDDRFYTKTPGKVRLSRLSPHIVHVQKDGYEPAKIEITRGMSWWVIADLSCLLWVVSCVSKDLNEGGFFTLDDEVHVRLTKSASVERIPQPPLPPLPPTPASAPPASETVPLPLESTVPAEPVASAEPTPEPSAETATAPFESVSEPIPAPAP